MCVYIYNAVYLVYIINSAVNVTRSFTLGPQTNLSPVFTDEESEFAQGHMGSKWQNYSNYKSYAVRCYVLLPLSVQSLMAPAA